MRFVSRADSLQARRFPASDRAVVPYASARIDTSQLSSSIATETAEKRTKAIHEVRALLGETFDHGGSPRSGTGLARVPRVIEYAVKAFFERGTGEAYIAEALSRAGFGL